MGEFKKEEFFSTFTGVFIMDGVPYPIPAEIKVDAKVPGIVAYHPPTGEVKVFKTYHDVPVRWFLLAEVKKLSWYHRIYRWLSNIFKGKR